MVKSNWENLTKYTILAFWKYGVPPESMSGHIHEACYMRRTFVSEVPSLRPEKIMLGLTSKYPNFVCTNGKNAKNRTTNGKNKHFRRGATNQIKSTTFSLFIVFCNGKVVGLLTDPIPRLILSSLETMHHGSHSNLPSRQMILQKPCFKTNHLATIKFKSSNILIQ